MAGALTTGIRQLVFDPTDNQVTPGGTVCRAAAGACDVAEQCTGTVGQTCPANGFAALHTAWALRHFVPLRDRACVVVPRMKVVEG